MQLSKLVLVKTLLLLDCIDNLCYEEIVWRQLESAFFGALTPVGALLFFVLKTKNNSTTAPQKKEIIMKKLTTTIIAMLFIVLCIVNLSACFNALNLEINFVVDGEQYATATMSNDGKIDIPKAPEKDGYIFDGWYWDDGVWNKPIESTDVLKLAISNERTVYAKWKSSKHVHSVSAWIEDSAPSCEADGSRHKECTECGEILKTEAIDALAHTESNWIVDTQATCKAEGKKRTECTVCKKVIKTDVIAKLDHTPSNWIVDTVTSCSEEGVRHKECTVCHEILDTRTVEKLAHTPKDAVEENVINPDCKTEGSYDAVIYCAVCNEKISSTKETIAKTTTHTYTDDSDTDCNICGDVREPICAHNNTTVLVGKKATCTKDGLTDGLFCNDCNKTVTEQTVIPASHTIRVIKRIEPECEQPGQTEGSECSVCHKVLVYPETIRALGHTEGDWITETEPTEQYEGYKVKRCIRCNKTMQSESIPVLNDTSLGLEFAFYENTITIIGIGRFSGKYLNIPEKIRGLPVATIGERAFENCTSLYSITLPGTVTAIESYAFKGCTMISEFTIPASVTSIGKGIFDGATKLAKLNYNPSHALSDYSFITNSGITKVTFNGTIVPDYVLYHAEQITEITLNGAITYIGNHAFERTSITSITLPSTVTKIGDGAFSECLIYSITLPDGITSIGSAAFYDCSNLKSITIPSRITEIKEHTFAGCDMLTTVKFTSSIISIGDYAFASCPSLKTVYYSGSAEQYAAISIGSKYNQYLLNASVNYNSSF